MTNSKHILLVEDNEGDIMLTTEALKESASEAIITVVKDGKEAIEFLNKTDDHANKANPDIILLDINLPKMNGHEVLQYIKNNDNLKQIPVIILTTSSSEADINLAYKNFANCYITKPVLLDNFFDAIKTIENFWMRIVKLPTKHLL